MVKLKRIENIIHALFIAFAIILLWRGIWTLSDVYLFPDNLTLSSIISILIGLGILIADHKFVKKFVG